MTDAGPQAGGQTGGDPKPAGDGSGDSPKPGGDGSGGRYSQEQVDAFVAEAKRRETARFSDYDTIKSKLADLEAAGQTELERAQAQAKDADARAGDAVRQRDRLMVRSALTAAAARAGAVDPDVVVALLSDDLKVDGNGAIDGDVDKLVTSLLEQKPYLVNGGGKPTGVGSADQGAHSSRPAGAASETPHTRMDDLFRQSPTR